VANCFCPKRESELDSGSSVSSAKMSSVIDSRDCKYLFGAPVLTDSCDEGKLPANISSKPYF